MVLLLLLWSRSRVDEESRIVWEREGYSCVIPFGGVLTGYFPFVPVEFRSKVERGAEGRCGGVSTPSKTDLSMRTLLLTLSPSVVA